MRPARWLDASPRRRDTPRRYAAHPAWFFLALWLAVTATATVLYVTGLAY